MRNDSQTPKHIKQERHEMDQYFRGLGPRPASLGGPKPKKSSRYADAGIAAMSIAACGKA